jgi:hypothetical protein
MRKQDEPLFDQEGSILMNDEGKKPCREDTVGTEWLKASWSKDQNGSHQV